MSFRVLELGVIDDGAVNFDQYKARVQAVGVALLFAYSFNYLVQMYVTFIKKDEGKQPVLRRLLETSQVMYWFGIASIFSFVPPFFYGAFNAVMAYITLVIVILFNLSCFTTRKIKNRHVWSLLHFFYHLSVFVWILIGMILGFMWSEDVYSVQQV